ILIAIFFQAEDGIRVYKVTGVQTCALPISNFAYDGPSESGLRYARWDGGKWVRQTIDNEPIEFFNFIRIAPDGFPRISYYHRLVRGETGEGSYALHLKYAAYDGARWYTETVDPRSGTGKFNSLTLDRQGLPNIAYSDVTSGDL